MAARRSFQKLTGMTKGEDSRSPGFRGLEGEKRTLGPCYSQNCNQQTKNINVTATTICELTCVYPWQRNMTEFRVSNEKERLFPETLRKRLRSTGCIKAVEMMMI